MTISILTYVPR